jgi:hypothetical protein
METVPPARCELTVMTTMASGKAMTTMSVTTVTALSIAIHAAMLVLATALGSEGITA